MLGKVLHVDSNNSYKNNGSRARVEAYRTTVHNSINRPEDTSDFSRESIYFSTLPWKLKNYKFRKNESVSIDFELNSYLFNAEIDISKSKVPARYNLKIAPYKTSGDNNFNTVFNITLLPYSSGKASLNYLSTLFQRVRALKIYTDYKIYDDSLLYSLWEDLQEPLTLEMGYITNIIYQFFKKLIGEETTQPTKEEFYCSISYLHFYETNFS